ncbi:MAG: hypothetical protein WBB37_04530 [bacterium]
MKWSVHPAYENYKKTILSLVFIVGFLVFIAVFYGVFWGLLGFAILLVSLYSYFFPSHYEVDEEYVTIKNIFITQRRRLSEFKKVYRGKNGILLSPFKRKTFLNQFRGVFLLLPRERGTIEEYVRGLIEKDDTVGSDHPGENA